MTAGQDALIEAMRIEQAKIYGQLSSAFTSPVVCGFASDDEVGKHSTVTDIRLARKRKGVA